MIANFDRYEWGVAYSIQRELLKQKHYLRSSGNRKKKDEDPQSPVSLEVFFLAIELEKKVILCFTMIRSEV